MYQIDLNSDMGESFGAYSIGNDDEIIKYVTTANVACGWHGGDPMVMDKVVKKAAERKVAVGAHPGYPDLMGFGRRKMVLKPSEVKNYIKYQVGALMAFTASYGMKLQHVAPHGALGNLCQYDRSIQAICEAVYEIARPYVFLLVQEQFWGTRLKKWDWKHCRKYLRTGPTWMICLWYPEGWMEP